MWPFTLRKKTQERILALVRFDPRETELITSTLRALRTDEAWALGEPDPATVVLVNLDSEDGRSLWWALRRERSDRLVAGVTADPGLGNLKPLLSRPVRGKQLGELLDQVDSLLAPEHPPSLASSRASVAEVIAGCPFDRFILATADGTGFVFDRVGDRIHSRGDPDRLREILFRRLGDGSIRELRQRPDQLAGIEQARSCRLTLMLAALALNCRDPESLPCYAANVPVGLSASARPGDLPLSSAQRRIARVLERAGPIRPLDLVIHAGEPARQAAALLAALWLTGGLVIDQAGD